MILRKLWIRVTDTKGKNEIHETEASVREAVAKDGGLTVMQEITDETGNGLVLRFVIGESPPLEYAAMLMLRYRQEKLLETMLGDEVDFQYEYVTPKTPNALEWLIQLANDGFQPLALLMPDGSWTYATYSSEEERAAKKLCDHIRNQMRQLN